MHPVNPPWSHLTYRREYVDCWSRFGPQPQTRLLEASPQNCASGKNADAHLGRPPQGRLLETPLPELYLLGVAHPSRCTAAPPVAWPVYGGAALWRRGMNGAGVRPAEGFFPNSGSYRVLVGFQKDFQVQLVPGRPSRRKNRPRTKTSTVLISFVFSYGPHENSRNPILGTQRYLGFLGGSSAVPRLRTMQILLHNFETMQICL